jgi:glutathione S-transferase
LSTLDFLGEIDWSISPSAKDWYARIKSRPSFRGVLNDRVSAMTPPEHYADLDF